SLAGCQLYPGEAAEAARRAPARARDVDLHHVRPRPRAGVGDLDHGDEAIALARGDEMVVIEAGVREAVAEGEQRHVAFRIEPLVTDQRAFRVGEVSRARLAGPGELVERLRKGRGQVPPGIDRAGEHACD